MPDLVERVRRFVAEKELFSAPCRVILGLSGGADSMALLHILRAFDGVTVEAVHVHHGLRGDEADRDEAFVTEQCAALGVPLSVHRVDVAALAASQKVSTEEAGRRARYALFDRLAEEGGFDAVATAHHGDDQAETVLMRLLRGSGVDGLAGIPAKRGCFVRPLLDCTRKEIEAFCREQNIAYVTDSTNFQPHYRRNCYRHELLPALERYNPAVKNALCRLADHAAEDSAFLLSLAEEQLLKAKVDDTRFDVHCFIGQPSPIRRRMAVLTLKQWGCYSYDESHLCALDAAICAGKGGVSLPGGVNILVSQGWLQLTSLAVCEHGVVSFPLPRCGEFVDVTWWGESYRIHNMDRASYDSLSNVHKMFFKYSISCDTIHGNLCVRSRREGDYMHPAGRHIGKSLKKLLIEWKVPSLCRDAFPLLCDEEGILLVPGYTCDERVRPHAKTNLFLVWQPIN